MARLNEDPPSLTAEAFETLKRRFLRQNRELAKANSNQSVKVRALEAEVAKLLSETITLKDANHQLECELARYRQQYPARVASIHGSLEAKVAELSTILRGLDKVYQCGKRHPPTPERIRAIRPQASRPWRAVRRSLERNENEDLRLPVLNESTEHSGITPSPPNVQSISELLADTSLSPEIGPPPIAHLDPDEIHDTLDVPTVSKSRRKKRESIGQEEIKRVTPLVEASERNESKFKSKLAVSPRSSLKRKLSATEQYNLPIASSFMASKDSAPPTKSKEPSEAVIRNERQPSSIQPRIALAPRDTNIEPLSPRRPSARTADSKPVPRLSTSQIAATSPSKQPATPAALDLLSPLSSQPSSTQQSICGSPPPTSLGASRGGGRRARAAVSYAEPNLRDKMRRPTKELVDAVAGEGGGRKRLSSSVAKPDQGVSDEKEAAVVIKSQLASATEVADVGSKATQEQAFRAGATSPLQDRTSGEKSSCLATAEGKKSFSSRARSASAQLKDVSSTTSLTAALQSLEMGDESSRSHQRGEEPKGRRRASSVFGTTSFSGSGDGLSPTSLTPESGEEDRKVGRRRSSVVVSSSKTNLASASRLDKGRREAGQEDDSGRTLSRRRSMMV